MLSPSLFGQHIFTEKQYNCNYQSMSLENSKILVEYKSNDSLYYDLIKNVDLKYLAKVQGDIKIQLLINAQGSPCCVSILNETNVSSSKLKIVKNCNSMLGWQKPPAPYEKVCVIIELIYKSDKVIIKRLGVGDSRKFVELDSFEIQGRK
jgi:hypothetical protein